MEAIATDFSLMPRTYRRADVFGNVRVFSTFMLCDECIARTCEQHRETATNGNYANKRDVVSEC